MLKPIMEPGSAPGLSAAGAGGKTSRIRYRASTQEANWPAADCSHKERGGAAVGSAPPGPVAGHCACPTFMRSRRMGKKNASELFSSPILQQALFRLQLIWSVVTPVAWWADWPFRPRLDQGALSYKIRLTHPGIEGASHWREQRFQDQGRHCGHRFRAGCPGARFRLAALLRGKGNLCFQRRARAGRGAEAGNR